MQGSTYGDAELRLLTPAIGSGTLYFRSWGHLPLRRRVCAEPGVCWCLSLWGATFSGRLVARRLAVLSRLVPEAEGSWCCCQCQTTGPRSEKACTRRPSRGGLLVRAAGVSRLDQRWTGGGLEVVRTAGTPFLCRWGASLWPRLGPGPHNVKIPTNTLEILGQ